ncbi:LysR family transcriptional regulator [Vibrio hannami]|uniref:LysR family transcriptional regulator n=1 Tax=Vibrio hannami TaxID=2717094 RepID=UPI00240F373F|nr:LysR family transcriptional regulator [Vibrio hannami]MDG3085505.1 LysR family transcriptional regulator [Vibrio hannami]
MNLELTKYLPSFIHAATTLNFSQAARNLGVTPAAVSKNVKSLEEQLNLRLFHRSTHALSLTDEGEQFLASITPLAEQLSDTFEGARNLSSIPKGRLKVSLSYGFGKKWIQPLISPFMKAYPGISLDIRYEDRYVDLVEEGYDITLGNRADEDSRIVSRYLTEFKPICVASAEYIEQYGIPETPSDIGNRPCIRYRTSTSNKNLPWKFIDQNAGQQVIDPVNSVISVTTVEAVCDFAVQGLGLAMVVPWDAEPHLKSGQLIQVLKSYTHSAVPVRIYYPSRQQLPAKVRVFIDFICQHIH